MVPNMGSIVETLVSSARLAQGHLVPPACSSMPSCYPEQLADSCLPVVAW